jgi:ferric-dicitrate binding protein FerR (iron transport regulator)
MDQLFRKYLNSVLNPDEFSKVSDFLADKNNEALIYSLLKPFWDKSMIEDLNEVQTPNPELRNKILQAILIDDCKTTKRKLNVRNVVLRIAAILVIGLLIGIIFTLRTTSKKSYVAEMQSVSAPFGAKTNFKLPDGSMVWLNSGSTITFLSKFGKTRVVGLKGEAFFDVVKNGDPFIVSTEYGDVKVMGTTFNVNAFAGEDFQTTLVTGNVDVTEKQTGKEVYLYPGQQAGISGKELKVQNVDPEMFSSWKEGKLIFRNESLPAMSKRLERWYNVKIDLARDKRLSEISYTGVLEMESFSEVLQLLKITAPIDYVYNEKTRTIRIKYKRIS